MLGACRHDTLEISFKVFCLVPLPDVIVFYFQISCSFCFLRRVCMCVASSMFRFSQNFKAHFLCHFQASVQHQIGVLSFIACSGASSLRKGHVYIWPMVQGHANLSQPASGLSFRCFHSSTHSTFGFGLSSKLRH